MVKVTFSEARQNFASILNKAKVDGSIIITRKDGSEFELKPIEKNTSPLAVEGINLEMTAEEIVEFVRESRES